MDFFPTDTDLTDVVESLMIELKQGEESVIQAANQVVDCCVGSVTQAANQVGDCCVGSVTQAANEVVDCCVGSVTQAANQVFDGEDTVTQAANQVFDDEESVTQAANREFNWANSFNPACSPHYYRQESPPIPWSLSSLPFNQLSNATIRETAREIEERARAERQRALENARKASEKAIEVREKAKENRLASKTARKERERAREIREQRKAEPQRARVVTQKTHVNSNMVRSASGDTRYSYRSYTTNMEVNANGITVSMSDGDVYLEKQLVYFGGQAHVVLPTGDGRLVTFTRNVDNTVSVNMAGFKTTLVSGWTRRDW